MKSDQIQEHIQIGWLLSVMSSQLNFISVATDWMKTFMVFKEDECGLIEIIKKKTNIIIIK